MLVLVVKIELGVLGQKCAGEGKLKNNITLNRYGACLNISGQLDTLTYIGEHTHNTKIAGVGCGIRKDSEWHGNLARGGWPQHLPHPVAGLLVILAVCDHDRPPAEPVLDASYEHALAGLLLD